MKINSIVCVIMDRSVYVKEGTFSYKPLFSITFTFLLI